MDCPSPAKLGPSTTVPLSKDSSVAIFDFSSNVIGLQFVRLEKCMCVAAAFNTSFRRCSVKAGS